MPFRDNYNYNNNRGSRVSNLNSESNTPYTHRTNQINNEIFYSRTTQSKFRFNNNRFYSNHPNRPYTFIQVKRNIPKINFKVSNNRRDGYTISLEKIRKEYASNIDVMN